MKIIPRIMLTLRSTSLCMTPKHVYEDEVLSAGRKRGTSVETEFFQIHFPNAGALILISDTLISKERCISTCSETEFSLRESLI